LGLLSPHSFLPVSVPVSVSTTYLPFPLISFPFPHFCPSFSFPFRSCKLASFPFFLTRYLQLLFVSVPSEARPRCHFIGQTCTLFSNYSASTFPLPRPLFTLSHRRPLFPFFPIFPQLRTATGYAVWLFNSLALTNCIALIAQVTLEMCQKMDVKGKKFNQLTECFFNPCDIKY